MCGICGHVCICEPRHMHTEVREECQVFSYHSCPYFLEMESLPQPEAAVPSASPRDSVLPQGLGLHTLVAMPNFLHGGLGSHTWQPSHLSVKYF